jgi:hypothetical protein
VPNATPKSRPEGSYPRGDAATLRRVNSDTCHLEVALRNAYGMNRRSQQTLDDARRGLGANPTHGQVVAAITFGFWTKLTERDRAPLFWNPMLHRAFVGRPTRPEVHDLVSRINKFRNRLAHNEPVFSSRTGLHDRLRDVETLFDHVAPAAAAMVRAASAVPAIMASCPVSGLLV